MQMDEVVVDYQLEEEEFVLPEIEYETARMWVWWGVNVPSVGVFGLVFGGSAALGLWPWPVGLLLGVLLAAVYSVVAINRWQNWLGAHAITREEAEIWRRRLGLDRRGRLWVGLILGAAVVWLGSLLV